MKNYVLSLMAMAVLTLIACQKSAEAEATEKVATSDYAAFDKKVEVLRSFF